MCFRTALCPLCLGRNGSCHWRCGEHRTPRTDRPHSPTPYPRVTRIPNLNNHTEYVRRASLSHFEHSKTFRKTITSHRSIFARNTTYMLSGGFSLWWVRLGHQPPWVLTRLLFSSHLVCSLDPLHCNHQTCKIFFPRAGSRRGFIDGRCVRALATCHPQCDGQTWCLLELSKEGLSNPNWAMSGEKETVLRECGYNKSEITGVCECGYSKSWPWISAPHRSWCLWHSRDCSSRPFSLHVVSTAVRQSSDLSHDSCEAAKILPNILTSALGVLRSSAVVNLTQRCLRV